MKKHVGLIAIATSLILAAGLTAPASAHISVVPGVSSTGNTTDALTVGKNNTLNFRVGHGCSLEKNIRHPRTKKLIAAAEVDHFSTSTLPLPFQLVPLVRPAPRCLALLLFLVGSHPQRRTPMAP
jgi:hypothetical protein